MAWCTSWMFFKDVDGIRKNIRLLGSFSRWPRELDTLYNTGSTGSGMRVWPKQGSQYRDWCLQQFIQLFGLIFELGHNQKPWYAACLIFIGPICAIYPTVVNLVIVLHTPFEVYIHRLGQHLLSRPRTKGALFRGEKLTLVGDWMFQFGIPSGYWT